MGAESRGFSKFRSPSGTFQALNIFPIHRWLMTYLKLHVCVCSMAGGGGGGGRVCEYVCLGGQGQSFQDLTILDVAHSFVSTNYFPLKCF